MLFIGRQRFVGRVKNTADYCNYIQSGNSVNGRWHRANEKDGSTLSNLLRGIQKQRISKNGPGRQRRDGFYRSLGVQDFIAHAGYSSCACICKAPVLWPLHIKGNRPPAIIELNAAISPSHMCILLLFVLNLSIEIAE